MIIQVQSLTNPKKIYKVDSVKLTCTCPGFIYRYKVIGYCKHITKVLNDINKDFNLNNLIKQDNNIIHFINKFGEERLNNMINNLRCNND
jgi:hypothetical protein